MASLRAPDRPLQSAKARTNEQGWMPTPQSARYLATSESYETGGSGGSGGKGSWDTRRASCAGTPTMRSMFSA